jgi:hypothetical protein
MNCMDYQQAIDTFFVELSGTMAALPDRQLTFDSEFLEDLNEIRRIIKEDYPTNADLVGLCFGIVDEYIHREWESTTGDGYKLYTDMNRKEK